MGSLAKFSRRVVKGQKIGQFYIFLAVF